jgi:hypothetical protein
MSSSNFFRKLINTLKSFNLCEIIWRTNTGGLQGPDEHWRHERPFHRGSVAASAEAGLDGGEPGGPHWEVPPSRRQPPQRIHR